MVGNESSDSNAQVGIDMGYVSFIEELLWLHRCIVRGWKIEIVLVET
jgi:hypothetical protein